MRKAIAVTIAMLTVLSALSFGQSTSTDKPVGTTSAETLGMDSSQQKLEDVTVEQFEDPGLWYGSIMNEYGFIQLMQKQGFPKKRETYDKERIANEQAINAPIGTSILGVKVTFFKRAVVSFGINPVRPLPIPGLAKTVSIWVVGRSFNHTMKVVLEDFFGNRYTVPFDKKLTFQGWDKLTAVIPPSVAQSEKHFTGRAGIKIVGLTVNCDLKETYGTFYMYLDDMSAITDLFTEESRDIDDVVDDW